MVAWSKSPGYIWPWNGGLCVVCSLRNTWSRGRPVSKQSKQISNRSKPCTCNGNFCEKSITWVMHTSQYFDCRSALPEEHSILRSLSRTSTLEFSAHSRMSPTIFERPLLVAHQSRVSFLSHDFASENSRWLYKIPCWRTFGSYQHRLHCIARPRLFLRLSEVSARALYHRLVATTDRPDESRRRFILW